MTVRPRSARPQLEQLEDRVVPAGNITAVVQGTTILVTGDGAANGLEVSRGTAANTYVFRGLVNGTATTINGGATPVTLTVTAGPTVGTKLGDLTINLGSGNDILVITNRSEADNTWPGFTAQTAMSPLSVRRDLFVNTGPGDDEIQIRNADIDGNLSLLTEGGSDTAVIENVTVAGDANVDTAKGDDSVLLRKVDIVGETTMSSTRGNDVMGMFDSDFAQDVLVNLGGGNDEVSVEMNAFAGLLDLRGGGGTNRMTRDLGGLNTIGDDLMTLALANNLERLSEIEFSYTGDTGPDNWGSLTPAFLLADIGRQQSPVNIVTGSLVPTNLPNLDFNYAAATNLPFVNTGVGIQINYPAGSTLDINGDTFTLQNIDFHTTSEHTLDGDEFALEMHLTHTDMDGNTVVVAVFIVAGTENAAYAPIISNLPTSAMPNRTIAGPLQAEDLLPTSRLYYAYTGSLSTPPTTEGVAYALFNTTVQLSMDQITAIRNAIGVTNARPVQPTNNRVIFIDNTV